MVCAFLLTPVIFLWIEISRDLMISQIQATNHSYLIASCHLKKNFMQVVQDLITSTIETLKNSGELGKSN